MLISEEGDYEKTDLGVQGFQKTVLTAVGDEERDVAGG